MIITIGRQFGSGGLLIAKALSKKLGIPYYDRDLLALAAKESGLSEELFKSADEKPTSSLLYSIACGSYYLGNANNLAFKELPLNDQLFLIQVQTIKALADKGNCIIVGRCADYILEDYDNVLKVFVHAPLEARLKRAIEVYNVPSEKAADTIKKYDKSRAAYYNYHSDLKWGISTTYDICINSYSLGIDKCVDMIAKMVQ